MGFLGWNNLALVGDVLLAPDAPLPASGRAATIITARRLAEASATRGTAHDRAGSFAFEKYDDLSAADLSARVIPAVLGGGGGDLDTARGVICTLTKREPGDRLDPAFAQAVLRVGDQKGGSRAPSWKRLACCRICHIGSNGVCSRLSRRCWRR